MFISNFDRCLGFAAVQNITQCRLQSYWKFADATEKEPDLERCVTAIQKGHFLKDILD